MANEPEPLVVEVNVRDGEDPIDAMLLAMVRTQMSHAAAQANARRAANGRPPIEVDVRLGEPASPE